MMLSQKILVKSRNTCLKIGYIIGVSEIMDLGQEARLIKLYASQSCGHVLLHSIGYRV